MAVDKNGNNGSVTKMQVQQEQDEDEEDEGEEDDSLKMAEEDMPTVVPPDGGFGWVIVFVGFMSGVIVDGIIFSFGIIFTELQFVFNDGKSKTAWIGSTMAGMYLIVGPVVSALANRYGCRLMAIVGSVIGFMALAASMFANSVTYLILTYGVLGGIGFGFIYLPCIVMVQFYFDKKRAFATGISVCGSGMGAFVFAPLNTFLIGEYGWRGCILVQSAIVLNMIALGMLLRPLSVPKAKNQKKFPAIVVENNVATTPPPPNGQNGTFTKSFSTQSFKMYESSHEDEKPKLNGEFFSEEQLKMLPAAITIEEAAEEDDKMPESSSYKMESRMSADISNRGGAFNRRKSLPVNINEEVTRPFYRQDIFFSGSLLRIPQYSSHTSLQQYRCSVVSIPKDQRAMLKGQKDKKWKRYLCPKTIRHTINTMLDFSLLKSPTFIVLCTASFITMTGFFIPFVYLADYAGETGISKEDSALMFSVIGIANTLGRIFSGWVSDRPNVNALFITNVALTTGGAATALVPFLKQYELLLTYSAVFGLAIACFASLRSIILVELLGLEKLTNAFGLLLLFQGIASMIGSPMAGFFYDMTSSYNASFFIAGGLIALSGIMGFPMPYISKWENRKLTTKL